VSLGRPVPTGLAVALFALALVPAALSVASPAFGWLALAVDVAVLLLCAVDFARAPRARDLEARREVEPILSSGVDNPVRWELGSRTQAFVRGELRDEPPLDMESHGHRQAFVLEPGGTARLTYRVRPPARGDARFGDVSLRLSGPLGLCARQVRLPAGRDVKVYPDLSALSREALAMARSSEAVSARVLLRKAAEGREFESLREYRPGDDYRHIDWKSSARHGHTLVRTWQPERHQPVLLLLDCGRHMAGRVQGRRKLDHAVDAALRLARVSLDAGDMVGVLAFASDVRAFLPPRKGAEHLRLITESLYRAEAGLEESDYGRAFDFAFARQTRRALVVLFTDLVDPDASASLLTRTLALRPRHLPVVASLLDEDLEAAATDVPGDAPSAYARQAAARMEAEYRRTATTLRDAGALVVRAPARGFGAAALNVYLDVKARGRL
jgi:uncharacterized protein (DUF58 family)